MFPVVAIAAAGWLLLSIVLLAAGPADDGAPRDPYPGDQPAVVSLLAGRLDKLGFGAPLADLAIRGWFQVTAPIRLAGRAPAGRAGTRGPGPW